MSQPISVQDTCAPERVDSFPKKVDSISGQSQKRVSQSLIVNAVGDRAILLLPNQKDLIC